MGKSVSQSFPYASAKDLKLFFRANLVCLEDLRTAPGLPIIPTMTMHILDPTPSMGSGTPELADPSPWLSHLVTLSAELLGVIGNEGCLLHANAAWQATLGRSLTDLCREPFVESCHLEDRPCVVKDLARLEVGAAPALFEARFRGGDGEYRWLEWKAARLEDGICIAARDLTDQKENEQTISDAYQKLTYYMVNSPLAFVEWDRALRIRYWSPETERVFGWDVDTVVDKRPNDWAFVHEEDAEEFLCVMTDLLEDKGQRYAWHGRHYTREGRVVHCEWFHSVLRDDEGEVISIFSLALDVTERNRTEAELVKIRKAVESASDAICISDEAGKVIHINQAFTVLLGYSLAQIDAIGMDGMIGDGALKEQIAAIVAAGLSWKGELELTALSSGLIPVMLRANAIKDEQGRPIGGIFVCTDLSEKKQAEKERVHLALHDALTGLPNRNYFMQRLNSAFLRWKTSEATVACMFVDLDNFKVINDSLGHEVGDELLKAVSKRLLQCVRPEDMIARLGGDEFILLIENLADEQQAQQVAERVLNQINEPLLLAGREVIVTASIGITLSHAGHEHSSDLLRDADVAMYQAKVAGKSGYVTFDASMNAESMERLELEMDLRTAVDHGELEVFFQPIVQLASGALTEAEALVRWRHPVRGLISPVKFIPIAEETGLIVRIGEWVLRQSCLQAKEWQSTYGTLSPHTMSVNLSTRQLSQEDLIDRVRAILEETGLEARRLKLEVTESAMILDSAATIEKLKTLRDLGIRIAVDDFGTGYSSMAYLSTMPVDTLKIDRAFVSRLGQKSEDDAIVRAILSLARTMGLSVTAEGIETEAQLKELSIMGCDRGQGYLFSKPLPALEFETFMTIRAERGYEPAAA